MWSRTRSAWRPGRWLSVRYVRSAPPHRSAPAPRKSTLREMLERGGLLPATSAPFDFVSRQARMPSAYTFRRTRLPVSKAKALAQESRALREQVASDSAPP